LKTAHPVAAKPGADKSLDAAQNNPASGDVPDILHDSLGYAIQRAKVRTYEMLYAACGSDSISPARMTALSIIGTQPGTNQSALAEQLRITRASIVKVIDNLEALELVERRAIPGDRRSYCLVLTEKGREELRSLHEKTRLCEVRIAQDLSAQERALLISLLDRVALGGKPAA
jgi:DNA-binding MarR family transcriptional regulator